MKHRNRDFGRIACFFAIFLILCLTSAAEGQPVFRPASTAAPSSSTSQPAEIRPLPMNDQGPANITVDFDNVDIQTFIKAIGEMTGKNFVIDSQVQGNVTVFSPKQISAAEAYRVFQSILEIHGYTTVPTGNIIKIVPMKDAREKNIVTLLRDEGGEP